ncbi:hypothetical protein GCM10018793_58160 [Streptomyces sulfonofaciens]|uniref:Uncharacterized protein n=1 Tax=Streptomyces sulfonofaciens TaxID=68272 RepID=A0A919GKM1_9ACTN|nr:hypothetical protein GCM10018793_58160 [Streptomyces sulfonofaciens]
MDVEVCDLDLVAAVSEFTGKDSGEIGCPFRTKGSSLVRWTAAAVGRPWGREPSHGLALTGNALVSA